MLLHNNRKEWHISHTSADGKNAQTRRQVLGNPVKLMCNASEWLVGRLKKHVTCVTFPLLALVYGLALWCRCYPIHRLAWPQARCHILLTCQGVWNVVPSYHISCRKTLSGLCSKWISVHCSNCCYCTVFQVISSKLSLRQAATDRNLTVALSVTDVSYAASKLHGPKEGNWIDWSDRVRCFHESYASVLRLPKRFADVDRCDPTVRVRHLPMLNVNHLAACKWLQQFHLCKVDVKRHLLIRGFPTFLWLCTPSAFRQTSTCPSNFSWQNILSWLMIDILNSKHITIFENNKMTFTYIKIWKYTICKYIFPFYC